MADVYELNTIADLLKVPADSLDACLRDLRYALELCHLAGGEDTPTMAFNGFTWTDDGQHNIDMSMNGEPFLKLNVTDDAALSHAAGKEVEIPHPLGERHAAIEKALKGQTLLLMSRDHVNDQKKPLAEIKFGMSTDLGVLFCLADTEAPMPVDPAVARSEGEAS